jgi:L-lactate dehydrogenase complex protein LldF
MSRAATSERFDENARQALADPALQGALAFVEANFPARRRAVVDALPEFDALRDSARDIKAHTLAHLDLYLEAWEKRVIEQGGHVHYAPTAADANRIVLDICRAAGARTVTKGKSMVGEEIGINEHLEQHGIVPVETDLGEYIIQIRDELPSHIIMPAVHLNRQQIAADFRRVHTDLPKDRDLDTAVALLSEARTTLRKKFLAADVGITGANFLIAETGSSVIVTNEGNGDLTCTLPRVHIVLASIEKLVPTMEDMAQLLRVLARSATGQEMSVYTTITTGPRRSEDQDGPDQYHVVIVDNGRSAMLAGEFRDMLRCIRCGACMNHCPVYHAVGGHAYGFVYPGPMGAVLTPSLLGVDRAGRLPNASTFCGRCEEVCPVRIPLPRLMRFWRDREFSRELSSPVSRAGLAAWAFFARNPWLYRVATGIGVRALAWLGRTRGKFGWLPLAGGFAATRDIAAPQGATFQAQWRRRAVTQAVTEHARTVPSGNPHGRASEPHLTEPAVSEPEARP